MAGAVSSTPSVAAASAAIVRDRDLPPMFDGGDPLMFKRYQKDLELWQFETELPKSKHGVKMLRQLTGTARAVADELSVPDITAEDGASRIMARLKEHFAPYLESALPRAFERAIYAEHRKGKESIQDYVIRMDAAFKELEEEGVKMNDTVKGYVVFRHASLTQVQEDQVTTWTAGSYEREKVIKALRKLEKVTRDQKSKSYITEEGGGEAYETDEAFGSFEEEDPDYVWIGDGDLNEIYDEEDLQHALATYQEVRKAIRDQRTNRQSWGKGKGKDTRRFPGPFKNRSDAGARRIHVDMLKLRTKCARCGQVGHWAKECQGQPDTYAKNRAASSGASTMSGKSGFFSASVEKGASVLWEGHGNAVITLGRFLRKAEKVVEVQEKQFCGIATQPELGVVDTAAQSGLIGEEALNRLQVALHEHGLKVAWRDRKAQARGVGGEAQVVGVAEVPLGIGGICGVLECTVVRENVPLLLPVKLLRELGAQIDLFNNKMCLNKFGVQVSMEVMPSGHATTSVMDFGSQGWSLPDEAKAAGLKDHEFRECDDPHAAMIGIKSNNDPNQSNSNPAQNVFAMASCSGAQLGGRGNDALRPRTSASQLEAGGKQNGQANAQTRRSSRRGGSLAARWICCWIMAVTIPRSGGTSIHGAIPLHELTSAYGQARQVRCSDTERPVPWPAQMCQETHGRCGEMHTPEDVSGSCREWSSEGGVVSRVPRKMESGIHGAEEHQTQGEASTMHTATEPKPSNKHQQPMPHDAIIRHDGQHPRGDQMPPSTSSQQADGEEGGPHQGQTLLQVPTTGVQPVYVGSTRGEHLEEPDATHAKATHTGASQRIAGSSTGSEEAARGAEGQGNTSATYATGSASNTGDGKGSEHRSDHTTPGGNDEAATASSYTDSTHARASAVDDRSSRRGEDGQGLQRHSISAADSRANSGTPQGDGATAESAVSTEHRWDDAPWMCPIRNQAQLNAAAQLQLRTQEMKPADRKVAQGYWRKETGSQARYEPGILPGQMPPGEEIYVEVMKELPEEDYLDEVDSVLKKGCRKRLVRAMQSPKFAEVYSEPRVTAEAHKQGHSTGGAYDIKTGYDFNQRSDRERCFRKLEEEDPDVLVLSPPCGPFSILQELNIGRMGKSRAVLMIQEGLVHLEFAARLYEWQVRRGKIAIFEHPKMARSWKEPALTRCMSLPGVETVEADQSEFGLRVKEGEALNKKPTRFMVNSEAIRKRLARKCRGDHEHQSLMEGRAKLAERYPPRLCKAMIQGAREHMEQTQQSIMVFMEEDDDEGDLEDALDEEVEAAGGDGVRRMIASPAEEEVERGSDEDEEEVPCALSPKEKKMVEKLHKNMGHPSTEAFARALRMARARHEVVRYVKKEFTCELCKEHQKPKPARPTSIPKAYEANQTIGVDIVYMPWTDPTQQVPVLNIVDWGTCFQVLEPAQGLTAEKAWTAFMRGWVRIFGMPKILVVDQGREFLGEFARKGGEHGALIRTIGARAPWQNGRTERHGGVAKAMLRKMIDETVPISEDEWMQCLHHLEATKNTMFNRSGYSPAQRQLGQNVRIPGSLMSDDDIDEAMFRSAASKDMQRSMEIREKAMEAFARYSAEESVKKASRARGRATCTLLPGEVVYVYRKPLPRRSDARVSTRAHVVRSWDGHHDGRKKRLDLDEGRTMEMRPGAGKKSNLRGRDCARTPEGRISGAQRNTPAQG